MSGQKGYLGLIQNILVDTGKVREKSGHRSILTTKKEKFDLWEDLEDPLGWECVEMYKGEGNWITIRRWVKAERKSVNE